MASKKPASVSIRTYQVGFGDCFLLSFSYGGTDRRHVLIDFGTTALPKNAAPSLMKDVAEDVSAVVSEEGGRLVAVVATHRHQDHISGFAGKAGKVISALDPDVVLLPWTEYPQAKVDAQEAPGIQVKDLRLRSTLAHMESVAGGAVRVAESLRAHNPDLSACLAFVGEDNLKNKAAVQGLMSLGKKRRYLSEGRSAGLGRLLPGVRVHVLGPPTLRQTERIRSQVQDHEEEFWQLQAGSAALATGPRRLFPRARRSGVPPHARWFAGRLKDALLDQTLQIVRALDEALNNTSLILLFETRGDLFLFPGDAQWENWEHALGKPKYKKLLGNVHVYKVGHHGSRNATPKSLWDLFEHRSSSSTDPGRIVSLMSTRDGKHGSQEDRSEVPRTTLVDALSQESDLIDTRTLAADDICHVVTYDYA